MCAIAGIRVLDFLSHGTIRNMEAHAGPCGLGLLGAPIDKPLPRLRYCLALPHKAAWRSPSTPHRGDKPALLLVVLAYYTQAPDTTHHSTHVLPLVSPSAGRSTGFVEDGIASLDFDSAVSGC